MNSNLKLLPAALLVAVLALAGCGGGNNTPVETELTPEELAAQMQMQEATDAITAANMAALALSNSSDDAAVMAAEAAIQKAKTEIADLPEADQAGRLAEISTAETVVSAQRARLTAEAAAAAAKAEQDRLAAAEAERKAEEARKAAEAAAAAMAATAAKLYAGISAPEGDIDDLSTFTATDRAAAYNDANTGATATNTGIPAFATADSLIMVSIGDGTTTPTAAVALSEDKDTMVAALHGWVGKRYHRTKPVSGGTYEAFVYSDVGAATPGKKFGSAATVSATGAYTYQLDAADRDGVANKALTIVPETHASRVSLPSVTRTAGTETFKLPANNPSGEQYITVSGMLHGVSGTYSCEPAAATPTTCTAAVASKGFTLGGGTWLFIPSNAEARVMDAADSAYASYGWWLHKSADDRTYTASAFVDEKGTVAPASNLNGLNGTATYQGGAAGKYALSSSTGGTNDVGHFTARATLEADFTNNLTGSAITGTIDNFVGADGESRNWSVKLGGSSIGDAGAIGDATATDGTVWTIDGTAASGSGQWSGSLLDQPATGDGVPKVATGTFYSEYGSAGKMVGGFGANKQ